MDTPLLDDDALTGAEESQPSTSTTKSQGLTSLKQSIQATRTDYLQSLLKGSIPDLKLEDGHTNGTDDNNNNNGPSTTPKSGNTSTVSPAATEGSTTQMNIDELRQKLTSLRSLKTKHNIQQYQEVEVRLKDYSYHVPIRVDAPSIKTVFNQSPCYVGTTILSNVGELITGSRKVSRSLHIISYMCIANIYPLYISFLLSTLYHTHLLHIQKGKGYIWSS